MGGPGAIRRRSQGLAPRARILLVCEGSRTEVLYFEELRSSWLLTASEVRVVPSSKAGGSHPSKLLDYARRERNRARNDGTPFDAVWCVFDRDEHVGLEECFRDAKRLRFEVAFSNPCFELWYLLHFARQTAHIERNAAARAVGKCLGCEYQKSAKGMFGRLLAKLDEAIANAETIRELGNELHGGAMENPYTSVDLLVVRLRDLAGRR